MKLHQHQEGATRSSRSSPSQIKLHQPQDGATRTTSPRAPSFDTLHQEGAPSKMSMVSMPRFGILHQAQVGAPRKVHQGTQKTFDDTHHLKSANKERRPQANGVHAIKLLQPTPYPRWWQVHILWCLLQPPTTQWCQVNNMKADASSAKMQVIIGLGVTTSFAPSTAADDASMPPKTIVMNIIWNILQGRPREGHAQARRSKLLIIWYLHQVPPPQWSRKMKPHTIWIPMSLKPTPTLPHFKMEEEKAPYMMMMLIQALLSTML